MYTPPPKPAARPSGPARDALLPTFSAAPAGGQRPTAPTPVEGARLPAGTWNARARPPAEAATDSTTGRGAPVSVVYSEPDPVPQHSQQQAAEARPPMPLLGGYQPAAELPALAQLFPPQRQPPGAALGVAHAAGAAALPAVTLPPSSSAAAAVPGAAADDDMDLDGLLAGLGVGSSSIELQAPLPLVPGPLHQMPALVPNAGVWGAGSTDGMPPAAQQQQQPPPLWGAPSGTPWGTAEAPASAPPAPASLQAKHAQQGSWPAAAEQEEDAEMAAAIRASMASASASAAQQQAGAWQQVGGHAHQQAAGTAPAEAGGGEVALPGMRNEAGEYNCFINVIIQCLWRCAEFRQQVRRAGWWGGTAATVGAQQGARQRQPRVFWGQDMMQKTVGTLNCMRSTASHRHLPAPDGWLLCPAAGGGLGRHLPCSRPSARSCVQLVPAGKPPGDPCAPAVASVQLA